MDDLDLKIKRLEAISALQDERLKLSERIKSIDRRLSELYPTSCAKKANQIQMFPRKRKIQF